MVSGEKENSEGDDTNNTHKPISGNSEAMLEINELIVEIDNILGVWFFCAKSHTSLFITAIDISPGTFDIADESVSPYALPQ